MVSSVVIETVCDIKFTKNINRKQEGENKHSGSETYGGSITRRDILIGNLLDEDDAGY